MRLDVAIIGGGMAGATLARQLRRQIPDAEVAIFERSNEGAPKVGESLVEIATSYLVRRLGLQPYLYERHLPKNGLRFFFDNDVRSLELTRMSEIGSDALPLHPAFQIERRRFEADLLAMLEADCVAVHRGARVRRVELQARGDHTLQVETDAQTHTVKARFVVDASGRARVVQKTLGWSPVDAGHRQVAMWGRLSGVRDIDGAGSEAWRRRVRFTARYLSTNHFCYPGYWIWLIPLKEGVTSVGVVAREDAIPKDARRREGFLPFLRSHRAIAELLEGAEAQDFGAYGSLAYGTHRFFADERVAFVGEAAAFTDPFYSPGSDFIALENDLFCALVEYDRGDTRSEAWRERARLFDRFLQLRFDATMRLYRGLYDTLGSYELFRLKWDFDMGCYYTLWLHPYLLDRHLDPAWIETQLAQRDQALAVLDNFADLFRRTGETLREQGRYFDGNAEGACHAPAFVDFHHEVGQPLSRRAELKRLSALYQDVRARAYALLGRDCQPLPFTAFLTPRPLV